MKTMQESNSFTLWIRTMQPQFNWEYSVRHRYSILYSVSQKSQPLTQAFIVAHAVDRKENEPENST